MIDFKELKSRARNLDSLREKAAKLNTKQTYDPDSRFWYPAVDESGNSVSIIRFLPAPIVDGDDAVPFIKVFRHSFQDPDTQKWYIENCLTTIGKPDPVVDYCNKLYATKDEDDKVAAGRMKRIPSTICGVYIVKDGINPENNGLVKLFRAGNQVWQKVEKGMNPDNKYEEVEPINPFSLWEDGADFTLRVITKKTSFGPQRNYEESSFKPAAPLGGGKFDEDKLNSIWAEAHSLLQFIDPNAKEENGKPLFYSYEELKRKFNYVLGNTGVGGETAADDDSDDDGDAKQVVAKTAEQAVNRETKSKGGVDAEKAKAIAEQIIGETASAKKKPTATKANKKKNDEEPLVDDSELDGEDPLAMFQSLANQS